jgi:predicted nucleic acid-binding protein
MTARLARLIVDCSVVAKWYLPSELHASEARELMLDGERPAVQICAPDQLRPEILNTFLKAYRRNRVQLQEARDAVRQLLAYPFTLYRTTPRVISRAFDIAVRANQHAYDCVYVALAEAKKLDFWTGDERLYNAVHAAFPFVRRIADYQRTRP